MDGEAHVDPLFGERVIEFPHLVLRLGHCHAITRHDDHFIRCGENRGCFLRRGAAHRLGFLRARGQGLHLAEGSEENVREGTVHCLRHDDREDEARRSVKRASNNQQLRVENESHGRS